MKKTLFGMVLTFGLAVVPSTAALIPVSFNTTNTLTCGSNTSCTVVGNALRFSALTGGGVLEYAIGANPGDNVIIDTVNSPNQTTNFGSITPNCISCTSGGVGTWDVSGAFISIALNQTSPFAAATSPAVVGTLNGTVERFASNAFLSTNHRVQFGGDITENYAGSVGFFDYTTAYLLAVQNGVPNNGYSLSISNLTSLQATVTATVVDRTPPPPNGEIPEPTTVALIGAGLIGLASIARRRS